MNKVIEPPRTAARHAPPITTAVCAALIVRALSFPARLVDGTTSDSSNGKPVAEAQIIAHNLDKGRWRSPSRATWDVNMAVESPATEARVGPSRPAWAGWPTIASGDFVEPLAAEGKGHALPPADELKNGDDDVPGSTGQALDYPVSGILFRGRELSNAR